MMQRVIVPVSNAWRSAKRSRTVGVRSMRRSFRRFARSRAECRRRIGRRTHRGSAHHRLRQAPQPLERSPRAMRLCRPTHGSHRVAASLVLAASRDAPPGPSCSFVSSRPAQPPVLAAHMWRAPRGSSMGPLSTRARPYLPLPASPVREKLRLETDLMRRDPRSMASPTVARRPLLRSS